MKTKNDQRSIDLSYLKQLSNGSNQFVAQMLSVFIKQTPETIANMEQCLNDKNWRALHALAHRMKPSFSFMGIKSALNTINLIEEYSLNEINLYKLPGMVAEIKKICDTAIQELEVEIKLYT